MAIGITSDQLHLVSVSIFLIERYTKEIFPNYDEFYKFMRSNGERPVGSLSRQYKQFSDNSLVWWADQPVHIQSSILEKCIQTKNKRPQKEESPNGGVNRTH